MSKTVKKLRSKVDQKLLATPSRYSNLERSLVINTDFLEKRGLRYKMFMPPHILDILEIVIDFICMLLLCRIVPDICVAI